MLTLSNSAGKRSRIAAAFPLISYWVPKNSCMACKSRSFHMWQASIYSTPALLASESLHGYSKQPFAGSGYMPLMNLALTEGPFNNSNITSPTCLTNFWFNDGNVVLHAESCLSCVHHSILLMHSGVFWGMFFLPQLVAADGDVVERCLSCICMTEQWIAHMCWRLFTVEGTGVSIYSQHSLLEFGLLRPIPLKICLQILRGIVV